MRIQFFGACRTVTGSQILVSVNGSSVLLECGLFQGRRSESLERNRNFPFDPSGVGALLLSHAHMDHSGNTPNLVARGFGGSVYATPATVDLCKIMLRDSAFLQERDVAWVNRIRSRKGEPPTSPLYTTRDVNACLDSFVGVEYDRAFSVAAGVSATFRDAGHILGAASILLEVEEGGQVLRVGFTGDIGRMNMPLTHDPNQLRDLDVLIMESTYGERFHPSDEDTEGEIARYVNETAKIGGKIIIPSFAVGRTQLIVYFLHKLYKESRIPEIPIFVDSPLACRATDIFRAHLDELDRETERIFLQDHEDPFGFRRLRYVETVDESKSLNSLRYPHIIISASGMAEGGRILHHLRNNMDNHKALLLFVGYAAEHTLARRLMRGEKKIRIFGEEYKVKCRVEKMESFSAHADRRELLRYVDINDPARLKNIFLNHGETGPMESLRNALRSKGYLKVHMPQQGNAYELSGRRCVKCG